MDNHRDNKGRNSWLRSPTAIRVEAQAGQAIILIALAMVGLLAFTALAIDGGRLFLLQRDLQNATDAAMVAAVRAVCKPSLGLDPVTEGEAAALVNGFDGADLDTTVSVQNPPSEDPGAGENNYVKVEITSSIPGTFSQIIFSGPLEVTSSSTGRCDPGTPGDFKILDNAIQSLACGDVPGAIKTHGTGTIDVYGGDVHTDSTASGTSAAAVATGGSDLTVNDGAITAPGDIETTGGSTITDDDPPPDGGNPSGCLPPDPPGNDPLEELEPPDDPDPGNPCQNVDVGSATIISPGKYCDIRVQNKDNLTMLPGLYYIEGEFSSSNGGNVTGHDVIIYMAGGGDFKLTGGDVILDAPDSPHTWAGMLVFMARSDPVTASGSNNGDGRDIELGGGGVLDVTGTIYGRDSNIMIEGGASGTVNSAILGYIVDVGGNGDLTVTYDPNENYKLPDPPSMEIVE